MESSYPFDLVPLGFGIGSKREAAILNLLRENFGLLGSYKGIMLKDRRSIPNYYIINTIKNT